mgnify:CR=1 FL=1
MKKSKVKKEETLTWKKREQICCVLISVEGKTYQVALDKRGQEDIAFILPQLFDDYTIKILPDELPIKLSKLKK